MPESKRIKNLKIINPSEPGQRWLLLLVTAILAVVTLACGLAGAESQSVAFVRDRLPTLTRTPLPTLTPTAALAIEGMSTVQDELAISSSSLTAPTHNSADMSPEVIPAEARGTAGPASELASQPSTSSAVASADAPTGNSVTAPDDASGNTPPDSATTPQVNTPSSPASLPTPTATATTTVPASSQPTTPSVPPSPTLPPTATPLSAPVTAEPDPALPDWVFSGIRLSTDQGQLHLHGDLINNTGMSQEIVQIISTFYDEQGEIIPFNSATNTLPMKKLPPDGRVPFELTVTGIQDPNSYNLRVEARPSNESPYQDFDFLNVDQSNQGSEYCISGSLHNPGLSSYLTVVAILYDGEDQVVHFGKGQAPSQRKLANNNLIDFDICVDSLNQKVARHELRAWGL